MIKVTKPIFSQTPIRMPEKSLSLSWLNGQLKFLHVRDDLTVATWECSGRVEELGTPALDLPALLREAVQQTGYTGKNVALVLEHPQLIHQLVDMPPAQGREQVLYIERLVAQWKVSEGENAWGWQPAESIKQNKGVVLYMFPQVLQDHLIDACRAAGLHLILMVSTTVVLGSQLAELPLEDREITLLASEIEGKTALVVGRKQGPVFSERSVRHCWHQDSARIVLEINRSIRFVKQQFGADVNSICFFGPGAEQQCELLAKEAEVPVRASPVAFTPFYWAEQLRKIAPNALPNLISKRQREAPRRRALARITGFLTGALLVLPALVLTGWIEMRIRAESNAVTKIRPHEVRLQAQKDDLQNRMAELKQKKEFIQLINGPKLPPIPGWILVYIANNIPNELLLSELQVKRMDEISEGAGAAPARKNASPAKAAKVIPTGPPEAPPGGLWSVRLVGDGKAAASAGETAAPNVLEIFERWTNQLTTGPIHLKITKKTLPTAQTGKSAEWLMTGGQSQGTARRPPFIIEGVIR
jgi:hypothetical protein